MKKSKHAVLGAIILGCLLFSNVVCSKRPPVPAKGWTSPTKLAETEDSFGGAVFLYKWHDTVLAWQMLRGGTAKSFFLNRDQSIWSEGRITGVPSHTWAAPDVDKTSDRLILKRGYSKNEQLFMTLFVLSLNATAELKVETEKQWTIDKEALLGETDPNIKLTEPGLGLGRVTGPEIYVPYCLEAENTRTRTHFNNGVFYSPDFGKTWRIEKISDFMAGAPAVCKTERFYYYFALREPIRQHGLWFSRKSIDQESWESPTVITPRTFAHAYGDYDALGEGDTVHVCWLDDRHEKMRLSIDPNRQNYEVMYTCRRDSDQGWSKDIILSKGMLYSYRPSMSVEGDKIVVAWAGISRARDGHGEYDPNDIHYVTSKDGGKTWIGPLKVTDGAKDGITTGWPQVVLLNGIIHLTYVQGKMSVKQESPGLTKLGQAPWPIYYTRRPFPD